MSDKLHGKEKLNEKQREALKLMKSGKNIFITGQAGTGKSFTIYRFVSWCKSKKICCAITSTTGVSALLIKGRTLHSWAGILLGREDKFTLLERVQMNNNSYFRWAETKVLIIDEISMMQPDLLEKLDYIGKKIRKNHKPFGGIQLILSGDFCQLPPVKSDYCFKYPIWNHIVEKSIYLTENMRQSDQVFRNLLSEVRLGDISEESIRLLEERIGAKIDVPDGIVPTKLYSHKGDVERINRDSLYSLVSEDNPITVYNSKDIVRRKSGKMVNIRYKDEYLKRANKVFTAVNRLEVCIGAQVMLIYNTDVSAGLANGSRGVIIGFKNGLPIVRFMNGIEISVDRVTWDMKLSGDTIISRNQIPLILATASTIHKCQGSTLDCAQIDLGETIFVYGQSYTALSRCKTLESISIVTLNISKIQCSPDVKDFYYNIRSV